MPSSLNNMNSIEPYGFPILRIILLLVDDVEEYKKPMDKRILVSCLQLWAVLQVACVEVQRLPFL